MFSTAEEAALAYNKKSREMYGDDGKINVIRRKLPDGRIEEIS